MNVYSGARSIALRRDLDALSIFYEERSAANLKKQFKLSKTACPGLSFLIHGLILLDCEHFVIDFLAKPKNLKYDRRDIILQIGARLPQNYIIRNSRIMGKWGPEENSSNLPFQLKRGKTFWMQVLLTDRSFFISVNGFHFATYNYRMPYKWISGVDVRGDVSDIVIDIFHVTEYPIRVSRSLPNDLLFINDISRELLLQSSQKKPNKLQIIESPAQFVDRPIAKALIVPFYGRMLDDEKLVDGRMMCIEGRVRLMPQSFCVTLQCGQNIWPHPTISLLFSPNFLRSSRTKVGKAIITRSAYINGKEVNREVSRLHTYLGPGKAFVLIIACRKNCYELFVNGHSILTFKHQMNPADIDMVNIRGDVKLWNVVTEVGTLPGRMRQRANLSSAAKAK
ncbi:32 kDa beta-galactoside-binding lectin [Drosophila navojoa]|uniref:32 kDa beta-galactoside-binding lectin n=1 Tax=Drosophila navojoa TaxID=7232 RepID=UPI0008468CA8|nr:32 kDa beta-galactoside-binding lectin [Drosophila navojoa]